MRDAICLFSGPGGGSSGVGASGFRVVLAVDFDAAAVRAHRHFHPDVPVVQADLSKVDLTRLLLDHGIDPASFRGLILVSPPCPGFGNGGKRDPNDVRNRLIQIAVDVAAICPNAWVVIENVPGLLALRNRPRLAGVLRALRGMGRDVPGVPELWSDWVLDARHYGVPQRRRRVFIVAPPPGVPRVPPPPRITPVPRTLREVIGPGSGFIDPDPRAESLTRTESVVYLKPDCGWSQDYFENLGKDLKPESWDHPGAAVVGSTGNGGSGRVSQVHPDRARYMTIGEQMAKMGFPLDRGPIPASMEDAQRLVGDAIVPPVAGAVARQVLDVMEPPAGYLVTRLRALVDNRLRARIAVRRRPAPDWAATVTARFRTGHLGRMAGPTTPSADAELTGAKPVAALPGEQFIGHVRKMSVAVSRDKLDNAFSCCRLKIGSEQGRDRLEMATTNGQQLFLADMDVTEFHVEALFIVKYSLLAQVAKALGKGEVHVSRGESGSLVIRQDLVHEDQVRGWASYTLPAMDRFPKYEKRISSLMFSHACRCDANRLRQACRELSGLKPHRTQVTLDGLNGQITFLKVNDTEEKKVTLPVENLGAPEARVIVVSSRHLADACKVAETPEVVVRFSQSLYVIESGPDLRLYAAPYMEA